MWLCGLAVSFLSAAVIADEILLMRLLSIVHWHHFAYMIISLALLGFGASGSFVVLTRRWVVPRFASVFAVNSVLFGLAAVASFALAQRIPFNALEVIWDRRQFLHLVELYLVLSVPFFCAANCIVLTYVRFRQEIHRIYRFDLVGAGVGALGIILCLFAWHPLTCLRLIGVLGWLSAALVSLSEKSGKSRRLAAGLLFCGIFLAWCWPDSWLALRISEYKGLSLALRAPDAQVVSEHSSPLGLLNVVRSPTIPFRHAPGMSLNYSLEPPPQLGIFTDGDSFSALTRYQDELVPLAYLDALSSALPFHLLKNPSVLILGAGGGQDVLQATYHQASRIAAVELNPQMVALVRSRYADFAGHLYEKANVEVHIAEARGFVSGSRESYDLILLSLFDSFSAATSGVHALAETYLYTVEAFQEYLQHLRPGGLLSITRWLRVPPRDSVKLFATAVTALEQSGSRQPEQRLALIRSWNTSTLLVKNGVLSPPEIETIRNFCAARSFDLAYYPGMPVEEANRHNLLDEPYLYQAAKALLGKERLEFFDNYKFYVVPATDDRPHFFHFFKWRILPEIFALRGKGGAPLLEWGYLIVVATLVQAALLSVVLILLPLWSLKRSPGFQRGKMRIALYFLSLGCAFLFMEMAFIQKFILFLSHPLYAVAVILCAFLVFAGMGSGFSGWWLRRSTELRGFREGTAVSRAAAVITVIALLYAGLLPVLFRHWMHLDDFIKIAISIMLICTPGFFHGDALSPGSFPGFPGRCRISFPGPGASMAAPRW